MARRKFLIDYIAVMISIGFYFLRPLVLIPVILLNMGTTSYGIWTQILTTSMLLSPLISLRLNNVLVRYLSGVENRKAISSAYLMAIIVVIVGSLILFMISTLIGKQLTRLIYGNSELIRFLWPALAYSGSCAFFELAGAYLNTMQRQIQFAAYRTVLVLGDCLIIYLLVKITDISACTYALSGWQVGLSIIIFATMITQAGLAKPSFGGMPGLWPFLFSLLVSHLLSFGAANGNLFVLVNLMGLEKIAAYQVALQIATVVGLAGAPNQYILIPSLAEHWNRDEKEAMRSLVRLSMLILSLLAFPCIAFVVQSGPFAIHVLTGKSMNPDPTLLLMLSAGVFLSRVFQIMTYSYHLTRQIWHVLLPVGISGIINIGLPFVLVPRLGIRGAAISYLVSMAFLVIATYRHSTLVFGTGPDWRQAYKALLIGLSIYFALWPVHTLNISENALMLLSISIAGVLWIIGFFLFNFVPFSDLKRIASLQFSFPSRSSAVDSTILSSAKNHLYQLEINKEE